MGKFWKDMETDELILAYNGILWSLKEEVHCLVREYDGVHYVIPQVCPTILWKSDMEPDNMDAKEAIESILKGRGVDEIPTVEFEMMSEEEEMWRALGWETYKQVKRAALDSRWEQ